MNTVIFTLLDTPAFGGAEQYLLSHLRYLCKNNTTVLLATNNKMVKNEMLSRLTASEKKTFTIIGLPYRLDAIGNWKGLLKYFIALPGALVWCYRTLKKLVAEYDDVICLWPGYSDCLSFAAIVKYFRLQFIWIEIGPLEPVFKRTWGYPRLLLRLSERFPDHIVTTSKFTLQSILKNTRFKTKDITLVYPGTTLYTQDELSAYKQKARRWLQKQKLENTMVIGLVARLAHENEVDVTIEAFRIFLDRYKPKKCILLIIGDGPAKEELELASQDIASSVRFFGFVSEEQKKILLSSCDLFVFPRAWDWDGFGMTTIEAMSLGLPVLTTNYGPQIEIVTNNKEGYKYNSHDSLDLSRKIEKFAKLSSIRKRNMSTRSLERAEYFSDLISNKTMATVVHTKYD